MSFAPGFTPTLVLTIPEGAEDLTTVDDIHVTLKSAGMTADFSGDALTVLSADEIEITLSQAATLNLWGNAVQFQLNWLYHGSALRWGTKPSAPVMLNEQFLRKVLPDE